MGNAGGLQEELDRLADLRLNGVLDPVCVIIAKAAPSLTPRFAIGFVDEHLGRHSLWTR